MTPLFAFAVLALGLISAPDHRPPNVVFVMADDLGYGELGCYGQRVIATPRIDALAQQGIRFTSAYAGSTVCAPSRCVLMTGLHTGHCRVRGNARVPLEPNDVTVAEVMKGAGYRTGIFGKWGLGEPGSTGVPTRQGFDEWFGYLNQRHAHNYYPEYLWSNEEKVPLDNVAEGGVATKAATYSHDLVMERAESFIDRHASTPYFLYVALTLPHVNNERTRATGDGMEVPHYGPYTDREWPAPEKGRAMMVHLVDQAVGRIVDALERTGVAERTVVLFTSDNGAQQEGGSKIAFFDSSGPLRGYKRALYDGGIRVPMIVRWPAEIEPGTTSDAPWSFEDVLPTLADVARAPTPPGLDGRSIVPLLRGEPLPDRALYWEFHEGAFKQAMRLGHYKAVVPKKDAPLELYDLSTDIGEQTDLADDHPELVARFQLLLRSSRTASRHWQK